METSKDDLLKQGLELKDGEEMPENAAKNLEEFKASVEKGNAPRVAMGLSDEMMDGIYGYAYRLYNTGKYEQAVQLFRLLVMLDPSDQKFLYGMAASFHMNKDYLMAAVTYMLTSLIDRENPFPFFHASDCYFQINDLKSTKQSLVACIEACKDKPEHAQMKEKATVMLQQLEESQEKIQEKK